MTLGRRPLFELEWLAQAPGPKALRRLNAIWAGLDHDAPRLDENGVRAVWRKPSLSFSEATAVLHALGWPCRWRAVPDIDALHRALDDLCEADLASWRALDLDAEERTALAGLPWSSSNPERLREVRPWCVQWFQGWSRKVDKLLPPEGPYPEPGRRRFGLRRGVKRIRAHNLASR